MITCEKNSFRGQTQKYRIGKQQHSTLINSFTRIIVIRTTLCPHAAHLSQNQENLSQVSNIS